MRPSDWNCVLAVERLHALHYSVDFISCSLGSWVSLRNFEPIRVSLMRPKWPKLASLAQKYAHSSFSSLVHSLLLLCFCSVLCLLCLCARLFICALWSPAGKGLASWLSFVVSAVSLSLSHWYPGSSVVLDCIDS